MIIAIAGPASNVLLVFLGSLLFPYLPITAEWYDFFRPGQPRHGRLQSAAHAALRWGRVLRSVLVRRRGFKQATAAIARVGGQVLSAFLAAWGGIPTLSGKKKAAPLFILAAACFLVSSAGTKKTRAMSLCVI